MQQPIR